MIFVLQLLAVAVLWFCVSHVVISVFISLAKRQPWRPFLTHEQKRVILETHVQLARSGAYTSPDAAMNDYHHAAGAGAFAYGRNMFYPYVRTWHEPIDRIIGAWFDHLRDKMFDGSQIELLDE